MAIRSRQNVLEAKKVTLSILSVSRKQNETEPWILVYHWTWIGSHWLPWSSVLPNRRKGPKWPRLEAHRFAASGDTTYWWSQMDCRTPNQNFGPAHLAYPRILLPHAVNCGRFCFWRRPSVFLCLCMKVRIRVQGHQRQKRHFSALSEACVQFVLGKTSLACSFAFSSFPSVFLFFFVPCGRLKLRWLAVNFWTHVK